MSLKHIIAVHIDELYDLHLKAGIDCHALLVRIGEVCREVERSLASLVRVPARERVAVLGRLVGYRGVGVDVYALRPECGVAVHVGELYYSHLKAGIDRRLARLVRIGEIFFEHELYRAICICVPAREVIARSCRSLRDCGVRSDVYVLGLEYVVAVHIDKLHDLHLKSGIDCDVLSVEIGEVAVKVERSLASLVRIPSDKLIAVKARNSFERSGRGDAHVLRAPYLALGHIRDRRPLSEQRPHRHAVLVGIGEVGVKVKRLRAVPIGVPADKIAACKRGSDRARLGSALANILHVPQYFARHICYLDSALKACIDCHVLLVGIGKVGVKVKQLCARLVGIPADELVTRLGRLFRDSGGSVRLYGLGAPQRSIRIVEHGDHDFGNLKAGIDDDAALVLQREVGVKVEQLGACLILIPARKCIARLAGNGRDRLGVARAYLLHKELAAVHAVDDLRNGLLYLLKAGIDDDIRLVGVGEIGDKIKRDRAVEIRKPARESMAVQLRNACQRRCGRAVDLLSHIDGSPLRYICDLDCLAGGPSVIVVVVGIFGGARRKDERKRHKQDQDD